MVKKYIPKIYIQQISTQLWLPNLGSFIPLMHSYPTQPEKSFFSLPRLWIETPGKMQQIFRIILNSS